MPWGCPDLNRGREVFRKALEITYFAQDFLHPNLEGYQATPHLYAQGIIKNTPLGPISGSPHSHYFNQPISFINLLTPDDLTLKLICFVISLSFLTFPLPTQMLVVSMLNVFNIFLREFINLILSSKNFSDLLRLTFTRGLFQQNR